MDGFLGNYVNNRALWCTECMIPLHNATTHEAWHAAGNSLDTATANHYRRSIRYRRYRTQKQQKEQ